MPYWVIIVVAALLFIREIDAELTTHNLEVV